MGVRHDLETNFDYEIVDEFLDHYSVMIDTMEPLIVGLAQKEFYSQNINELFRISHNIKSASAFLNIEVMNRFSIMVEDTLEFLRTQCGPASDEIVAWLLLCRDQLARWNKNLEEDTKLDKINFKLMNIPEVGDI